MAEEETNAPTAVAEAEDVAPIQFFFNDEDYANALKTLVAKARTDFLTYVHLFNPQGHSAIKLGDLHRYLIDLVQQVYDGDGDANNAVSVPPQHGKSTILSQEAPSWILGARPQSAVAITGFSDALVKKFSKAVRSRMEDPLYQLIFPDTHPVRGSNRADEWETTKGGSVVAKSAGSKLTGRRADWLILDDVHPGRAEAESPTMRKKVIEWYFADCLTRVHPEGKTFLIGTRWHPHDLIGHLTSEEYEEQLEAEGSGHLKFNYTNIPAVAEEGLEDPLGREPGEALFPEERPISYLMGMKASQPTYEWDSQYQGRPRSAASGQVDLSNLQYIKKDRIPWEEIDEVVRAWDTALSEKQTADYTVGALVGTNWHTGAIYILDIYRRRMNWAKMKPKIISLAYSDLKGHGPKKHRKEVLRVGIEGVSGFRVIVDEVRSELLGDVKVQLMNPKGRGTGTNASKLMRAQPWLNKLEKGLVYVVRDSWTKDFIDELDNFPEAEHDDQVDGVSIGHEMFAKRKKLLVA